MNLSDFYYDLPSELIAQQPCLRRDHARLMIVDRTTKKIRHDQFFNIDQFLPRESLIVLNDSKVISARLIGHREKTGGKVEIFLLNRLKDEYSYEALIRPLKRLNIGEKIIFKNTAVTAELVDAKKKIVRFNRKNMDRYWNVIGHMPLPPYIKRADNELDQEYYQTVYAKTTGSVAAPTAGLHFTKKMMAALKRKAFGMEYVTLHVNYGTFKSVTAEDITKHAMHYEDYDIKKKSYQNILKAKENGQKIVTVGTTSLRVLETVTATQKLRGSTNLFIYPGFSFKIADILITNFHFPCSTLLMLAYAFGGTTLMKKAYKEAIGQKYRLFSYGDAMVIL